MIVVRMVRSTTQSISQIILIYLFVKFSKPDGVKTEEGEDERRDMNLDMIYYMKDRPKMRRIKNVDYNVDIYQSAK